MADKFDFVVIGNSAAGLQAVLTLRKHARYASVALIDREEYPAYSRVLTPYYVGGKTGRDNLFIVDHDYYRNAGITTLFGSSVVAVDADGHLLELADGRRVAFGKLLLATGAEARTLAVTAERASTLRHMADADKLQTLMQGARSITAVGAGLVSLPLLSHAPDTVEKHLVVGSDRIFSRVVDAEASELLEERFRRSGLQLHKENDIVTIVEGDRLQLTLASGGQLTSDMLIVGKGVAPNTALARAAGLPVRNGILIDDFCRTCHADIYAAGDAAEGRDFVTGDSMIQGNWMTAVEQGENAALNMLGLTCAYEGSLKNNITEVFGVDIAAIGYCQDDAPQMASAYHKNTGRYRRVFLDEQRRVIGATLIGETNDAGLYYHWVRTRSVFPGGETLHRANTYASVMQRLA